MSTIYAAHAVDYCREEGNEPAGPARAKRKGLEKVEIVARSDGEVGDGERRKGGQHERGEDVRPEHDTSASGMAACPKISRNLSAGSSKFNPDKFHKTPASNAIRTVWFDSASGKAEIAPRNERDDDVLNSINKMPVENINRP